MSVVFKGFSIEVLNFGYALNVQDAFRHNIAGAHVFVSDLSNVLEEGFTDSKGCYYGNGEVGVTYVMTVVREGFFNYVHRFRIITAASLLFPAKNFPVLVYNSSDVPVASAQVAITAPGYSDSGTTSAIGLFEGTVDPDKVTAIAISKTGFTTYNRSINPYLKITCAQSNLVAVPVIVLS
jgi:hypothetical protein